MILRGLKPGVTSGLQMEPAVCPPSPLNVSSIICKTGTTAAVGLSTPLGGVGAQWSSEVQRRFGTADPSPTSSNKHTYAIIRRSEGVLPF